jgi:hypothetical protein
MLKKGVAEGSCKVKFEEEKQMKTFNYPPFQLIFLPINFIHKKMGEIGVCSLVLSANAFAQFFSVSDVSPILYMHCLCQFELFFVFLFLFYDRSLIRNKQA